MMRAANFAVRGRKVTNFRVIRDIIVFLHTCKNEEDPIKKEGARVLTRLYVVFSDALGQPSSNSAAEFFPNLNSSKLLLLSSLPVRMKKIQSNMKEVEC